MAGIPTLGLQFLPGMSEEEMDHIEEQFEMDAYIAMEKFRNEIERTVEVRAVLKMYNSTTVEKYLAGVTVTKDGDNVNIEVAPGFPSMLEEGCEKFDMKPGLLAGRAWRNIRMENGMIRRVSLNSRPDSWWHPGIERRRILEIVKEEEDAIRDRTVKGVMGKYFKDEE